jgi:hypothetical protein
MSKLSIIFGDLPDMLKQQVLEFATSTNSPFILSYSPKTKTIVKKVNELLFKEMLQYKINNPPEFFGNIANQYITITPPAQIEKYGWIIMNGKTNMINPHILKIHNKYWNMIRELKPVIKPIDIVIGDCCIVVHY